MLIHGLQKMTLLDFPEHVACTVFLSGCDFRCPYCHNYELVDGSAQPLMEEDEFFAFLGKRKGLLDGVAITGGEPLLRSDLAPFIRKIRDMGFLVKLDTNGYHPDRLKELLDQKLIDYIAMDIKNSFEKYPTTIGLSNINVSLLKESISLIMGSGVDYEFRTTVIKGFHEKEDFEKIGTTICGAKRYFLQQFVERDTVPDSSLSAPSAEEMELFLSTVKKQVENSFIRGL